MTLTLPDLPRCYGKLAYYPTVTAALSDTATDALTRDTAADDAALSHCHCHPPSAVHCRSPRRVRAPGSAPAKTREQPVAMPVPLGRRSCVPLPSTATAIIHCHHPLPSSTATVVLPSFASPANVDLSTLVQNCGIAAVPVAVN
jgi:hypothetical protein